jgi:hypothetical protein
MRAGDTFFSDFGSDHEHLWVIVSDPEQEYVLTVNLSSVRRGRHHDDTCILTDGEHDHVHHDTWVYFKAAMLHPSALLRRALRERMFDSGTPVSPAVLERIRRGFMESPHAKIGHQEMLVSQGLAEWE